VNVPLEPVSIPGLFITGTDTGVGKTLIAGAIAQWFARRGARVAVCKPAATGCRRGREGLVSEDAEFLASCAESRHPLDLICPVRYAEPLAPAIAAQRAREPLDWTAIDRALRLMSQGSDVIIVEGVGGIMVPMDEGATVLHMAAWLRLPGVVVARPGLGTINHTLLTVGALRQARIPVAGVVINRYPAESADIATEGNPAAIEHWGGAPVLCIVPEDTVRGASVPVDIADAVARVDWARFAQLSRRKLEQ
jgi:dethiobiotin synthetase